MYYARNTRRRAREREREGKNDERILGGRNAAWRKNDVQRTEKRRDAIVA